MKRRQSRTERRRKKVSGLLPLSRLWLLHCCQSWLHEVLSALPKVWHQHHQCTSNPNTFTKGPMSRLFWMKKYCSAIDAGGSQMHFKNPEREYLKEVKSNDWSKIYILGNIWFWPNCIFHLSSWDFLCSSASLCCKRSATNFQLLYFLVSLSSSFMTFGSVPWLVLLPLPSLPDNEFLFC